MDATTDSFVGGKVESACRVVRDRWSAEERRQRCWVAEAKQQELWRLLEAAEVGLSARDLRPRGRICQRKRDRREGL